jgi:hypothetical protein
MFCFILIFSGCKEKEHVCKPEKIIYKTTTRIQYDTITCVDTLVILNSTKLLPYPYKRNKSYISSSSLEIQPYELFKNGKTCDTILKEIIEYY